MRKPEILNFEQFLSYGRFEDDFIEQAFEPVCLHIDHVVRGYDVGKIIKQFKTWAVTNRGIECLSAKYFIDKDRAHESSWLPHMEEKGWVEMYDFFRALDFAKRAYPQKRSANGKIKKRYRVLRRDGFRCQLCGATALDGARIEVDHKIPKSKGGSDRMENLWALCFECNRGKSNMDSH